MEKTIQAFMENEVIRLIKNGKIDNEYGLQFELGCYLRENDYEVSFEKNIKNKNTCKHEIDLSCCDKDKTNSEYAIELKYPRGDNKGHTNEIYKFIQDIRFCEELKRQGYEKTYCITLVDDKSYYKLNGRERTKAWQYFRGNPGAIGINGEQPLHGKIIRQVKNKATQTYCLNGNYQIRWSPLGTVLGKDYWYYVLEI